MDKNLGLDAKNQIYQRRGGRPVRRSYPDETIMPDNDEYFMTVEFRNTIANIISAQIGRKMSSMEQRKLEAFIRDMPAIRFIDEQNRQRPKNYIMKSIANEFMNTYLTHVEEKFNTQVHLREEIMRQVGDNPSWQTTSVAKGGQADLRESQRNLDATSEAEYIDTDLRSQLGISDQPDTPEEKILTVNSKINDKVKELNDNILLFKYYTDNGWSQIVQRIAYVQFDSRYRDLSFNEPGRIRFAPSVAPELGAPNGQIKISTPLENIIKLKIEYPFFVPTEGIDFSTYQRVRLNIQELVDFGSITQDSNKFLFEFDASIQGQQVKLFPTNDEIIFRNSTKAISTITFEFRDPFDLIPFQDDRLQFTIQAGSNPMLLTSVGGVPHNVQTGDIIYFNDPIVPSNNYVSVPTNEPLDAIVNNPAGYKATKLNNTQLTVPIDLSTVIADKLQIVYFGSKRIVFRIAFVMNELAGEN